MVKIMVDIEVGSNGGFVVTWYKNNPTQLQRLAGIQQEKEQLAFANAKAFSEWLDTRK